MEQYISKSALIAEIERLRENQRLDDRHGQGVLDGLHAIEKFIETLKVKEVDLEKELNIWRHNHFHGRRDIFANGEYLERISQLDIAKHFFELGLKTKQTTI